LHPSGVAKSNTSFGWGKGWNVTYAGWQVTLCDPIWHVNSSSGVATSVSELLYSCYLLTLSFCRPDALPATQPTASKHWRQTTNKKKYMAYQILVAAIPMTFSGHQGHLSIASLFRRNFPYSYAAYDEISTGIACCAHSLQSPSLVFSSGPYFSVYFYLCASSELLLHVNIVHRIVFITNNLL